VFDAALFALADDGGYVDFQFDVPVFVAVCLVYAVRPRILLLANRTKMAGRKFNGGVNGVVSGIKLVTVDIPVVTIRAKQLDVSFIRHGLLLLN
jgi:hypothetical protein